ncbi:hypothetical protein CYY_009265 [Polysphondylium violaceum]|uniref:Uncharacterized protein n=1 Tax=Polysphondylium violaceum TaxID=133409 RepID=A0A8J4UWB4_9MYCE|nr:hypothetical protein CYY_009265 [Polysphondylium violaceum]
MYIASRKYKSIPTNCQQYQEQLNSFYAPKLITFSIDRDPTSLEIDFQIEFNREKNNSENNNDNLNQRGSLKEVKIDIYDLLSLKQDDLDNNESKDSIRLVDI